MMKLIRVIVLGTMAAISAVGQEPVLTTPLSHRGTFAADLTGALKSQTVILPAETELNIQVLSGIHSRVNRVDDPILARVLEPVYIRGKIVLPQGSFLDGRITMIRNSGHLHRPAELGLRFERITFPDGQERPIAGVLAALEKPRTLNFHLDAEGHLTGNSTASWKALFGGFTALGTFGALKIAAVGSAGISLALPAGGAALIGYEALWRRGREVNMPPDTLCRLRLNYPLTVRIPW
jgi:hypothetical protein